ncbi:hypothetical protein ACFL1N_16515 [Thermodesulfobacteriota bacterium]
MSMGNQTSILQCCSAFEEEIEKALAEISKTDRNQTLPKGSVLNQVLPLPAFSFKLSA